MGIFYIYRRLATWRPTAPKYKKMHAVKKMLALGVSSGNITDLK